jgi:hypothetical protein
MNNRKNIWINKTNLPRFEAERNKSGLINALLEEYYQPIKSFDQTIGVPAAKKAMDEMMLKDIPEEWKPIKTVAWKDLQPPEIEYDEPSKERFGDTVPLEELIEREEGKQ